MADMGACVSAKQKLQAKVAQSNPQALTTLKTAPEAAPEVEPNIEVLSLHPIEVVKSPEAIKTDNIAFPKDPADTDALRTPKSASTLEKILEDVEDSCDLLNAAKELDCAKERDGSAKGTASTQDTAADEVEAEMGENGEELSQQAGTIPQEDNAPLPPQTSSVDVPEVKEDVPESEQVEKAEPADAPSEVQLPEVSAKPAEGAEREAPECEKPCDAEVLAGPNEQTSEYDAQIVVEGECADVGPTASAGTNGGNGEELFQASPGKIVIQEAETRGQAIVEDGLEVQDMSDAEGVAQPAQPKEETADDQPWDTAVAVDGDESEIDTPVTKKKKFQG